MRELQVLVATMHRKDLTLADEMNIRCDAIIANQGDAASFLTQPRENGTVTMITTPTRGVGLNRNIALLAADADILLFADDDITYFDGTLAGVKDAFRQLPDADMIIFSVELSKNGEIYERRYHPAKRRHVYNALRFGACVIAVRRKSVLRANITFNQLFGGGCVYGSGEDTLFILDCFRHGLKVYTHPYVLGVCRKDSSSWFAGFGEKFFFDKGALFSFAFPKLQWLVCPFFAVKMYLRKKTELSLPAMLGMMRAGRRAAKSAVGYKEYKDGK